jgi:hypothetical protein
MGQRTLDFAKPVDSYLHQIILNPDHLELDLQATSKSYQLDTHHFKLVLFQR